MGGIAKPEEMVAAALALASDFAGCVNGDAFMAGGGSTTGSDKSSNIS